MHPLVNLGGPGLHVEPKTLQSSQENLVNGVEGLFGSLTTPYG